MSDGVFISDRPQLAIARQTVSFASLGLNDPTLCRIIYEVGNPYLSYVPTDEFNPISGITEGKSYLLYLNSFFDGSPALANAVLTNLIPQTSTNVFAGERVVFLCTDSVSFATAGINATNTNLITLVSEGYFTSYDPNDSINGIDGFVEGELYDIDPITDIDLHLYGVTKIRYSDEVFYLDSLEDVVVTNSNPDATLPLAEEEVLVRNITTGVWENKPVSDLPSGTSYTDEQAQDAVGTILSSEFTYDDTTPQISINQIAYSKLTGTPTIPTQYTDEMAQDATAALFAAGTHTGITFTYDDAGNKISAAVTGSTETDPLSVHLTGTSTATGDMTLDLGTTNELTITGNQAGIEIFKVVNTNTGSSASAIRGTVSGNGNAVAGIGVSGSGVSGQATTGIGVSGLSSSNTGCYGESTSGVGAQGRSSSSYGMSAYRFGTGTSNILGVMQIQRLSSSAGTANGYGATTDYTIEAADGFGYIATREGAYWKDATARTAAQRLMISGQAIEIVAIDVCVGSKQTTDATPSVMATINIDDESCGIIEVYIVARHSTTSGMVVGKKIMSYIKDGGTLTLGTATTVLANEITGSCIGSSYSISVVSNQLSISVTGVAATTINWKATINIIPS